jgi:hypothetical protein
VAPIIINIIIVVIIIIIIILIAIVGSWSRRCLQNFAITEQMHT